MDFSRQLKTLYIQSNDLLKEDGVIRNGMFYQKLENFNKFYQEIRAQLHAQTEFENPLVLERVKALPDIEIKNYDNLFSVKTVLYIIGYTLFFPIGIVYIMNKYSYVSKTKSKLREISSLVSSIEFLTREK
ncbi:MAG: hypothetical protein P1U56_22530 [Saprospiraceae bacterium]|nr:hypothetical protein [Saprospiraceae bacterium]